MCLAMTDSQPGKTGFSRLARRRRSVARVSWAALLAALVLLGGLEIHPASEAHDAVAALGGHQQEVYFPGASHPVQPAHAETATPVQRPLCAACLNRVQSMGARLDRSASLVTPLLGGALPVAVATSPLLRSLRPDGARAPPLC